jgi:hypothetical protein
MRYGDVANSTYTRSIEISVLHRQLPMVLLVLMLIEFKQSALSYSNNSLMFLIPPPPKINYERIDCGKVDMGSDVLRDEEKFGAIV